MFLESFVPMFAGTLGIGSGVVITVLGLAIVSVLLTKVTKK